MSKRFRPFLLLALGLSALALLAGCGGGGGNGGDAKQASADTDVDTLLQQTFSGSKKVDSGKLDLSLRVEAQGGAASGPIAVELSGPFQSQGAGKLPKFAMQAAVTGAGQDLKAGATSTGDKAFVNFQGSDYAVSDQVFQEFAKGYEQAQKQQGGKATSLATLGIDPRKWLTNPKNAGEAQVGDTDTIRITGGVDVPKLLDDVNVALEKARSLGLQGAGQIPEKLTDAQKQQAADAVKALDVEIYTGKQDSTLRRMVIDLDLVNTDKSTQSAGQSAKVHFDLQLLDLNQSQQISAPANAKPFDQLLGQLGGLGLGAGSGASSSGGGAADSQALQQYSQCIEKAGQDSAKAAKCADLLGG
jgi:hypothetical protein